MNPSTIFIAALVLFGAYKMITNAKNNAVDYVNDVAANTIFGEVIGMRTVTAREAAEWIKQQYWLTKSYHLWVTAPGRALLSKYRLEIAGQYEIDDIADEIIKANFVIFGEGAFDRLLALGLATVGEPIDHPDNVVIAITRIKNQVMALQVVDSYYSKTEKNLSAGLQWLPDAQMVAVAAHLKSIPTGAFTLGTNQQLSSLPKPPKI